jgi:hypothetical protein
MSLWQILALGCASQSGGPSEETGDVVGSA